MFKHADFYNSNFYDMTDFPKRFSMDTKVNQSGNRLIDVCAACDLRIVNGDDAGVGACTFLSHSGTSLKRLKSRWHEKKNNTYFLKIGFFFPDSWVSGVQSL